MFRQFQRSLGDFGSETNNSFGWRYTEFVSYVQLENNADPAALAKKWTNSVDSYDGCISES
jgi:hypothetical protein